MALFLFYKCVWSALAYHCLMIACLRPLVYVNMVQSKALSKMAFAWASCLYFLFIAGVVNVMVIWLFATCFHMGAAGVALTTVISKIIAAALILHGHK